jgi:hypothetical protein
MQEEVSMIVFKVEAGVRAEIFRVGGSEPWQPWTTRTALTFSEPISRTRTSMVFEKNGWLLRVRIIDVMMHNGIRWRKLG